MKTPLYYDEAGKNYNVTRRADPYLLGRIMHFLSPEKNKNYLDIGCGTGNYTLAVASNEFNFYGIDPSETMLRQCEIKSKNIKWIKANAENIPLSENSIDGAMATCTIHHWENLVHSFCEIRRVLVHNASFIIFTSLREQMRGYWLNHYFPSTLQTSIEQMPSLTEIISSATDAGFDIATTEKYFIQDSLEDHFLYCGKNKPELYFSEEIRYGISSFSTADQNEIESGLNRLRTDLNDGSFEKIKMKYENTLGDYIFIHLINKKT